MSRLLLLLCLLAAPRVRADAPAAAPLLALTPELVARWGYDADKAAALPPAQKLELQKQLTTFELGRLRRLEILRAAKPDDWRRYVTEGEMLTPEGMKVVDDYLAALASKPLLVPARIDGLERADGKPLTDEDFARARALLDRLFDGVAAHTGEDMSGEVVVDAHVRNEAVYDMTVTNPRTGLSASLGQLYVDGRFPQAAPSWYANLNWGAESKPESRVDYRVKASLGYVDLSSRYFADDTQSPAVASVFALGSRLGLPQSRLDQLSKYVTYNDPYEVHDIVVTSLLTQLGRAYPLLKNLDVSWTLGGLEKTLWVAPNAAFDETLGLRARLRGGVSVGLFGGAAQNLSPVSSALVQEVFNTGTVQPGVYLENDPHVSVALWGRVPGASDLYFSGDATQRWTATTQVHEADASLMTTFWSHPLAVKGLYSRETGPGIGFDRERARAEIDYRFTDDASAYLAYQRDHVSYGNAKVNSDSVLAGVEMDLGGGSRASVDHLFGGALKDESPEARLRFQNELAQIRRDLAAGLDVLDKANLLYKDLRPDLGPGQLDTELNQLALALSRLEPGAARSLLSQLAARGLTAPQANALVNLWLKTAAPGGPGYSELQGLLASALAPGSPAAKGIDGVLGKIDDWSRYYSRHEGEIRSLLALLTDERVWDAALIQAARHELLAALQKYGKVNVPILGHDFTLQIDAPALLAAANILQSRLSPLAPVTDGQVDAFLLKEAGKGLGLSGSSFTPQQVAFGLFSQADAQMQQQLAKDLAPLLDQLPGLNPQQQAAKILAALPPNIASLLKQNFGANLTSLLPANVSPAELKTFLTTLLPALITSWLERRYGAQLATALGQAASWAGDLLSREINMTLIQTLLASEELDRLTVDHGEKINDLDLRAAMRSFDQLDARGKRRSRDRLASIQEIVSRETASDEGKLADKFKTHGRTLLKTLQLSPAWPAGLRVEVDEEAWLPLMTLYGDGPFFETLERIKGRYQAKPPAGGLVVSFAYRPERGGGVWIVQEKDPPRLRLELTRPKDASDAAFKLKILERNVVD